MAAPEPYIDENGDERLVTRHDQSAMRRIAEGMGDVDGIPLDVVHMSIHRLGTFSLKSDIEGPCGLLPNNEDHSKCALGGGRSYDVGRSSVMLDFKHQTNGYLQEDAFDDYDVARWRSCP